MGGGKTQEKRRQKCGGKKIQRERRQKCGGKKRKIDLDKEDIEDNCHSILEKKKRVRQRKSSGAVLKVE